MITIIRYEITSDKWSDIPSMQNSRALGQTCNIGDKIYLIGGMQNKLIANKLIEIFNIRTNKFDTALKILNELVF